MDLMLLSMTHTSMYTPQLADRTESLNRSIKKRYVYLLSGLLKDRVGDQGMWRSGRGFEWAGRTLEGNIRLILSSTPSNSVKKSQPTLPISTIDERLQQYTQATEVKYTHISDTKPSL